MSEDTVQRLRRQAEIFRKFQGVLLSRTEHTTTPEVYAAICEGLAGIADAFADVLEDEGCGGTCDEIREYLKGFDFDELTESELRNLLKGVDEILQEEEE